MTIKADVAAADRLLKAAVRAARDQIRAGDAFEVRVDARPPIYLTYNRAAVVQMLTEAGRSAELLLSECAS